MDIKINTMKTNDLENIKDILATDFDDFWTYNILKDELDSDNSKYIVATSNSEIVGFAGIKIAGDQADVMNIVTKKTYRRKGIGTLLLNSLISICKDLNLTSIFLEVNQNNYPAIILYESIGFKKIGIRKNYYKDNDGFVYLKKIK